MTSITRAGQSYFRIGLFVLFPKDDEQEGLREICWVGTPEK